MQAQMYKQHFPEGFSLETPRVLLRLLNPEDLSLLLPLAGAELIWKYFTVDLRTEEALARWITDALNDRQNGVRVPFVIIDKDNGQVCGCTSYGNISFYDSRLEIGWSWLGLDFMGTGVNRQAKFALLSHAFLALKMERVEVKTDNLNERAKAALVKIGMFEEGVLRSHMQMHSNRRRDSVYYSILRSEWPAVQQRYFPDL